MKLKPGKFFHISFEIALLLKAVNGLLEMIGGVLLMFSNPAALHRIVVLLTQEELSEDPGDLVANALRQLSRGFSVSAQHFGVFYLLSHGVVKLLLVYFLWKKKLWAYPLTVFFLTLFILYQVYRYTVSPSMMMLLLTALDFILVLLTLIEYKKQKQTSEKPEPENRGFS